MLSRMTAGERMFPDTDRETIHQLLEFRSKRTDLADLLCGPISEHYVQTSSTSEQSFVRNEVLPLPIELLEQIEKPDQCSMGLLPAIDRAWLSVGGRLFLWKYKGEPDLYSYRSPGQEICTVELVKGKPDVFGIGVQHTIVIVTSSLVILHGVTTDRLSGKLQLAQLCLSSPTGNTRMHTVTGTDDGRIFMIGKDGHVYEVDYNKLYCKLTCRTESPFASFLPWFLKSAPEVEIQSIAIDDDRKLMYMLTRESTIRVISLGKSGDYSHIASINNVKDAALALCTETHPSLRPHDFDLLSLHTIPKSESKSICLSAVTSHGFRLYFVHDAEKVPGKIELVHVRFPSPYDFNPSALFHEDFYNQQYHATFYENSVFATSRTFSQDFDRIIISSTDVDNVTVSEEKVTETCAIFDVDGKVRAFSQLNGLPEQKENQNMTTNLRNEYVVLSDKALAFFHRREPSEIFAGLLLEDNTASLENFISRYGGTKSCLLCLILICANAPGSDNGAASRLFLKREAQCRRDAFMLYFARLVDPIWKVEVFKKSSQKELLNVKQNLDTLLKKVDCITQEQRNLLSRCIESINFVNMLIGRGIRTADMDNITLEEMVMTEHGHVAVKKLVEFAIKCCNEEDTGSTFASITEALQDECSSYFTDEDILLCKGLENLERAQHEKLSDNRTELLDTSVTAFKSVVHSFTDDDVANLCLQFCSLDHYTGAVVLAMKRASALSSEQDEPQTSDTKAVAKRKEAYKLVFQVMDDAKKQQHSFSRVLSTVLNFKNDKYFYFTIYDWMIQNDLLDDLINLESPFVEQYLSEYRHDLIGKDALWQYYKHNKKYHEAALSLKGLASTTLNIELDKRIDYLALAIDMAQLHEPDSELRTQLARCKDIAKVQCQLQKSLQARGESDAANQLGKSLAEIDELFNDYARAYHSWEEVLLLLKMMERQDFPFLRRVWSSVVDSVGADSAELISSVVNLGAKLYPSMTTFPVYLVVSILDDYCAKHHQASQKDIIQKIMCNIGVPEEVLVDAYKAISKTKLVQ